MSSDIILILTLAAIVISSPFISKLINIPTSIIEILIGSILATIGFIHKQEQFDMVAEVGFLYLMFLAGLEIDFNKLINSSKELISKSLLFLFLIAFLSTSVGFLLNFNVIFIVSLPLISVGLLATLSKSYKDAKWLEIAFTVGVLGEVASIIALTVLDVASKVGFSKDLAIELTILFSFIFIVIALYKILDLLFWWSPELKDKIMPKHDVSEQDIRVAIALFFIFIALMVWLHLELALGAFISGIAISAFFHHKKDLEEKMSSFGFGFLVPLFFIHVGTTLDLTSVTMDGVFINAILIVSLSLGIKILSAFVLKSFLSSKEVILSALSLSMPLTLLVAVATIGYNLQIITILNYYSLILASILEIVIAMIIIKILAK
jgi:Kef-type K+ transport system membrane component KefB